ncbi:hypothetical protein Pmar_PMAR005523 [Perkinsus marinus ATCC 50983]|uniref:Uncharacterized protein n=1 Tax=Perkinsus marinus (strain ATCC 50983 / TXsc) TaxID=423536 RepID=C5KIX1_PERM5|nr:hypothetical protein Pmar_PMAR005523 [Perkinsus marinus ATCC 50983]EER15572.1 hypothetical protein Pmar_PMAR005523 [Perkinsus marinus ATCC 50983]|eukprot:XP_002783776.1 hypothetical protein Pmar_PMAR005523 [Perkinsus marinus ATCC 50983]
MPKMKFLLRHLVEKHRIGQHAANKLVKELNVVIYAEDHPLSPNPQGNISGII